MSDKKIIIILFIVLFGGLAITAGTYFIKRGGQGLTCWSVPYGPLDEPMVSKTEQSVRGFPEWFYKEAVPTGCEIPDTGSSLDADISSKFQLSAAVSDFAAWGLLLSIVVGGTMTLRNRGRHE